MAGDESGSGPDQGGTGGPDDGEAADVGSLSTPRARAPWEPKDPASDDGVKHSALVGFMSVPVSRRFPLRRSTVLMVVAFLGLAAVLYFNPPQSDNGSGVVLHTAQGDVFVPNATPVSTTTTTTTEPPATTTTTTNVAVSPTTTTFSTNATTSTTTTTTTVPGGGGSGTAPTVTTSTGASGANSFGGPGTTTTSTSR